MAFIDMMAAHLPSSRAASATKARLEPEQLVSLKKQTARYEFHSAIPPHFELPYVPKNPTGVCLAGRTCSQVHVPERLHGIDEAITTSRWSAHTVDHRILL